MAFEFLYKIYTLTKKDAVLRIWRKNTIILTRFHNETVCTVLALSENVKYFNIFVFQEENFVSNVPSYCRKRNLYFWCELGHELVRLLVQKGRPFWRKVSRIFGHGLVTFEATTTIILVSSNQPSILC